LGAIDGAPEAGAGRWKAPGRRPERRVVPRGAPCVPAGCGTLRGCL